ncbi:MAG: hypothetical protein WCI91_00030 [Candidatus Nomurabacteria bacterium]
MKILFWKNKKNLLNKNKPEKKSVSFDELEQEEQDKILEKGAKSFSKKFTKIVDDLSKQ